MLTREDFRNNFKEACEDEGYTFNEGSLEEAIDFMFDVYADDDSIEEFLEDEDMDEEVDAKFRRESARKSLKETGSFEDPMIESLILDGFSNNFDEIHEGGDFSSIGEIIIGEGKSVFDDDVKSIEDPGERLRTQLRRNAQNWVDTH